MVIIFLNLSTTFGSIQANWHLVRPKISQDLLEFYPNEKVLIKMTDIDSRHYTTFPEEKRKKDFEFPRTKKLKFW